MTELLVPRPIHRTHALRTLVVIGALALSLTGCAGSATDTGSEPDGSANGSTETSSDETTETSDGEVQVIGADLPGFAALTLAKTYAQGRDPQPIVEFLDATTVRFTFPDVLDNEQAIGNCQIAWGSLQGEGIHVYITAGGVEQDCTAEMEG